MERCCIYKLKEGKSVDKFEESFSRYVYVEDFARNPLDKDMGLYAIYRYINIDTLEPTSQILNCFMLPHHKFEEHFELYMKQGDINKKIDELEGVSNEVNS